ncbi:3-isopropylmalate dehydratase large subunit [Candidatus Bathyarchaeota archaeon A05DMB-4]|nr:3-isopropylmalate dehydratase large subunit [Candidatus Bathyarchaeota archaeon A05DMB-4]MDH7594787.1 3-isopropylmalate dehydratase large subunit [Candidatus Bathyarchaeota archaeon]
MGMTIAEKILTAHSPKQRAVAGEFVEAKVDWAMVHEELGTPNGVAHLFESLGYEKVWNPKRIVALLDHWVPAPSVDAAEIHKTCRQFVKKYGVSNWFDMNAGICHQIMPEQGFVCPGELIVGTDSHTTTYGALGAFSTGVGATDMTVVFATGKLWFKVPETIKYTISGKLPKFISGKDIILRILKEIGTDGAVYKAIEYYGHTVKQLSIDGRMTICNMGVEAGAKAAIVPPDQKTTRYVKARTKRAYKIVKADKDAEYIEKRDLEISNLEPQVAKPPTPANSVPVTEVENTPIDEAFIGSCTGGRLEDLAVAAKLLKGKKTAKNVRFIVIPASYEIFLEAEKKGIIRTILEAGGIIESPTCGPCTGGHLGLLAADETAIATVSRNFVGRMGSPKAKVYLASAATVAASALKGKITNPNTLG